MTHIWMCYMLVVKRWKMGKIYSACRDGCVCFSHCCSYMHPRGIELSTLYFLSVCLSAGLACMPACLPACLLVCFCASLPTRLPTMPIKCVCLLFGSGILSMRRHFRLFTHNYAVNMYLLSACICGVKRSFEFDNYLE